jgi:hypothetical protein
MPTRRTRAPIFTGQYFPLPLPTTQFKPAYLSVTDRVANRYCYIWYNLR